MATIVGIIIFALFMVFLAQAIFETIWGICLIAYGIFWHTIGYSLSALAAMIRATKCLGKILNLKGMRCPAKA